MKQNQIGDSELKVSEICLGSMTWGEQNSERGAHLQLDFALRHGINFIDTAEMYPVPPCARTYARARVAAAADDQERLRPGAPHVRR